MGLVLNPQSDLSNVGFCGFRSIVPYLASSQKGKSRAVRFGGAAAGSVTILAACESAKKRSVDISHVGHQSEPERKRAGPKGSGLAVKARTGQDCAFTILERLESVVEHD